MIITHSFQSDITITCLFGGNLASIPLVKNVVSKSLVLKFQKSLYFRESLYKCTIDQVAMQHITKKATNKIKNGYRSDQASGVLG